MADAPRADSAETIVVSVVMPFLNAAWCIRDAVDSVLRQSWAALDVVLIDDGGTDGSDRIAHELAAADARVRVLAHEGRRNRGTGPSRALGITRSRGDVVAFLDADDVWEPHHLRDHVTLLQSHPEADIVCGRAWDWRSWADPAAEDELSELAFAPGSVVDGRRLLAAVLRNGHLATPTCSLMARREILAGVADHVGTFAALYEDQVINSWVQLRGSAVMSGATSAWYRMNPRSISARLRHVDPARARLTFLTWLQERVTELGQDDLHLEQSLATALEETRTWLAASAQSGRAGRLVDAVRTPTVRRQLARLRSAVGTAHPSRAESWPVSVDRLLRQNSENLRGDVLVMRGEDEAAGAPAGTSVEVRPWPRSVVAPGPDHPLATLPSKAFDCAVLIPRKGRIAVADLAARHLHRALRPAGALLVLLPGWDEAVAEALRITFGADAVSGRAPDGSRSPRIPVVMRAMLPAG